MDDTVLKLLVLRELLKQEGSDDSSTSSVKNVSLLEVGLKVIRGPDWKWENQEGGEGHIGTIVEIGRSDGALNKQVFVVWDNGIRGNYRIGHNGAYDLRTLDNSSIGVNHPTVTCNSCRKKGVLGMRWKCKICYDYDLCTRCYMSDKHDITHTFVRFQSNNGNKVDMPKREGSVKVIMKGILPSAKVVRGQDWKWETQDGGSGRSGIVTDVCGWDDNSEWNACHVTWSHNDASNLYRIGHNGKVDLKYIDAASDGYCYRDHLPITGDEMRAVREDTPRNTRSGSSSSNERNNESISRMEARASIANEYGSSTGFIHFCESLENFFHDGQFCDFIIKVGDREFPIHKVILAARSSVFSSMFQHDMQEKITGVADIPDCDPDVFEDFLYYMYSGKAKRISSSNVISLYDVAEKYDVRCLKEECVEFMIGDLSIDSVCDALTLACKYGEKKLMHCAVEFYILNVQEILLTAKWQSFMVEYPIPSNELYIKALRYRK